MTDRLLDTAQVAELLGVSRGWAREHATELGAIRLGDSPQAPLRFEPERIDEWTERRRLRPHRSEAVHPPADPVELLPLPEDAR